uniref:Uncharacterized protein n=1 Tax=Amphilophus citrinellus TaxID=61819 RepID=A0A3Q0SM24_AMPCI
MYNAACLQCSLLTSSGSSIRIWSYFEASGPVQLNIISFHGGSVSFRDFLEDDNKNDSFVVLWLSRVGRVSHLKYRRCPGCWRR